jgi:hypothetical protein
MTTVYIWGNMSLTGHASVLIKDDYLSFHPEDPKVSEDLKETLPSEVLGSTNSFLMNFSLREQPSELERISTFLKSLGPNARKLLDDATKGSSPAFRDLYWDKTRGDGLVESININGLDEDKMQSKLRKLREEVRTGKRKYHLFTSNCSTLSAEVLLAGAGFDKFDLYKSMNEISREISISKKNWILPGNSPNRERVLELVRDTAESVLFQYYSRGSIATPLSKVIAAVFVASDFLSREFIWTPGDIKVLAQELARSRR